MLDQLNQWIDRVSEYLAPRKGLLPFLGMLLIVVNLVLQFIPGAGFLAHSNLFLHLGIILALFGIVLAWAL